MGFAIISMTIGLTFLKKDGIEIYSLFLWLPYILSVIFFLEGYVSSRVLARTRKLLVEEHYRKMVIVEKD